MSTTLHTSIKAEPSVACLPNGDIVVVGWGNHIGFNGDFVVGRAFDTSNHPLGQFVIPNPYYFSWQPTVTPLTDNAIAVAWSPSCGDYGGGRTACDVFVQRYALTDEEDDCPGDCNGDRIVSINELVQAVGLALSTNDVCGADFGINTCPSIDTDLDCQVSIAEIIAAVNHALSGCP